MDKKKTLRNIYKFILATHILCFYSINATSQEFWQIIDHNDSVLIHDLTIDSQGRVYLATNGDQSLSAGGVYRSDDNCETWQKRSDGFVIQNVRSIDVNTDDILFASFTNRIYRSSNNGDEWQLVYFQPNGAYEFNVTKCGYDSIILIGGMKSLGILRSTDLGDTWDTVLNLYHSDYYEHITDIYYGLNNVIYACSRNTYSVSNNQPKVYQSVDYGKSWSVFLDPSSPTNFYSISTDNFGRLLIGYSGGIFRYDFGTETWENLDLNTSPRDILVIPDNSIFLACSSNSGFGGVLQSIDGGETYPNIINDGLLYAYAYGFKTDKVGRILLHQYAKKLYRSTDTIMTNIVNQNRLRSSNTSNISVFPNPCLEQATIKSESEKKVYVELLNEFGSKIISFKLEPYGSFILETSQFTSGLYILRFHYDDFISQSKLFHI